MCPDFAHKMCILVLNMWRVEEHTQSSFHIFFNLKRRD